MDFKVFLSHEALSDLERLVAYIASRDPVAAGRFATGCSTPLCPSRLTPSVVGWSRNFGDPICAKLCFAHIASFIVWTSRTNVVRSRASGMLRAGFLKFREANSEDRNRENSECGKSQPEVGNYRL